MELLDALQRSFEFAQEFNQKLELRQALKRLGFMREMKQLPGLLKQEREALSCSLKMLFRIGQDARMQASDFEAQARERLTVLCSSVLRNYVDKEGQLRERSAAPVAAISVDAAAEREAAIVEKEREVMGLVSIICDVVLQGLKEMRSEQFRSFSPRLFPLLCELVAVSSPDVRIKVKEILLVHVSPFFTETSP